MTNLGEHDVVIVGSGVAGMTAAYELGEFDPLAIEGESSIGGRVCTVTVAGTPMNLCAEYLISRTLPARHVIVSTPAPSAAAICRKLATWKVDALNAVWYAPWASVELVVQVDEPQAWFGSGSIPFLDGPVSLLLNNGPAATPGTVAIRLLSGGVRLSPFLDAGIDRLEALARTQFASVFPTCGRVLASNSRMRVFGAPHLQWGSPYGTRANIASLMAPVGSVHFCSDYMGFVDADADGGFGSGRDLDCRTTTYMSTAMRTGERAARAVRRSLTLPNRRKDRPCPTVH